MGFALCYPSIHGMEAWQALATQRVAEAVEREEDQDEAS
jgi:hypothetical protein